MSEILWSENNQYPTVVLGSNAVISTTGIDSIKKPALIKEDNDDEIILGSYKIASWFDANNDFPNKTAQTYLRKSPALRAGINTKIRMAVGQGVFPITITGYDANGNETIEPFFDEKIHRALNSMMVLNYLEQAHLNIWEYGITFPQMILNKEGNYASVLKVQDSPFCRFTKKNKGVIEHCIISGKWPDVTSKEDYEAVRVLDLEGTEDEIYARAQQLKNFIFPISIKTTGNIYYPLAPWDTARAGGHLDISIKIAEYLMYMFDNQMSIKYHIKIPYAYWEKKYPLEDYKGDKKLTERKEKIEADLDAIETNLTTTKNAKKAIISHFELNPQGKPEEKWEIDVIDDKFKTDQYLPQAAASNAEILTSLGIHPAVMGLSLSSGPYSNSGGGSDIREAFLVDVAMAWLDRQRVLAPLEMMLRFNFKLPDSFQLKTRATVLTTLDTGAGTQKTLS